MHEDDTVTTSNDQKTNLEILKKKTPVPIEHETKETGATYTTASTADTTHSPKTKDSKAGDPPAGDGNVSNVAAEKEKQQVAMDVEKRGVVCEMETTDADGDAVMEGEDEESDDGEEEEKKENSNDEGDDSMMEEEEEEDVQGGDSGNPKDDDDGGNISSCSNASNGVTSKNSAKKSEDSKANGIESILGNDKDENKTDNTKEKKRIAEKKSASQKSNDNGGSVLVDASVAPPPPVMKGTLSIDLNQQRRHLIRGMWNYEHSTTFPPQRFELVRNLGPDEDTNTLPIDGEFHGSFSLAYFHTTSKGKQKERSKVISETGVKITFTKVDDGKGEFQVDGMGTNQFGIFHIYGTASPSADPEDPTMNIVFRKRYEPGNAVTTAATDHGSLKSKKPNGPDLTFDAETAASGPLPEPAKSFPTGVVSLRGNLYKEESNDLGSTEVVHRANGMWASGLDFILADPQNVRGMCNRFEYEHKSSVPTQQFPVSGKYSGWFDLSNEDGTRTRINERDVTLKFRLNNAGYHNIEGKGSNVFGKYSITGTLTVGNVITIFRHFQPRKLKKSAAPPPTVAASTVLPSVAPSASAPNAVLRRPSVGPIDPKLSLDDVKIPSVDTEAGKGKEPFDPIAPPVSGTYSAVSRGVLRVNDDGSHSCQGKWAVTREHFTNGQTSNFNFRLEPHFAAEAAEAMNQDRGVDKFPLDSAMYKGSFQLKKQGSKYQTIVDQQIVMKFRKNKQGAFNVHGIGMNAIGEFNLLGTLVTSGKTGGQVELYRMYPPEKLTAPPVAKPVTQKPDTAMVTVGNAPSASLPPAVQSGGSSQQRRESSRMVKLPSRLEEDDPSAQLSRTMDKCSQILKFMREKDVELGAFFSEPVDPVALGIPTYLQVVKEPMDLQTIHRRMESGDIETPEEFSRLVRLVFENAMTFNIDPAHSVHQAARNLLVMFNQKFRDVERMVQSIRRAHGIDVEETVKTKSKDDKKRKRQDEQKSLKQIRLDEAQAMAVANANAVAAIVAAAPTTNASSVTRTEFSMLLKMIQQLQQQIVQTHTALADLSPGAPSDEIVEAQAAAHRSVQSYVPPKASAPASVPEKKKPMKRKNEFEESVATPDDSAPLSLEEQELLTETINEMPQEHLGDVIQIIREAAPVGADEDEIDLEIDQLDNRTQRKLLRHIQKFVKKSKPKPKKAKTTQPPKKADKSSLGKKAKPAPKPKPATTDSFFAFGGKDGSDSDDGSNDDDDKHSSAGPAGGKVYSQGASDEFKLGDGLDLHEDNDDDSEGDDIAANWNISKPSAAEVEKHEKDDDWGAAAREQAAAAKARDADRKAREEKKKAEAEQASKLRLAEAATRREEIKAQRAEDEAKEASLREQQEKEAEEARQAAKDEARAQLQSVEQTVDLDAQRDIMKQYDFVDKDLGGASPSSDFGF